MGFTFDESHKSGAWFRGSDITPSQGLLSPFSSIILQLPSAIGPKSSLNTSGLFHLRIWRRNMPFLMTDDSDRPNGLEFHIAVINRTKSCSFSHLFLYSKSHLRCLASSIFASKPSFFIIIQHRSRASSNSAIEVV